MNIAEYIRMKEVELAEWERKLERAAHVPDWRAKRDEVKRRIEELRADAGDRVDVLRMGLESAWDELKAAFDAATASTSHEHRA